ncbi:unnamed protein product [Peronospora belbahrii]|uniref:Uncharacterized protein n=1 Tax=Peronospora belbahrii TaxID=622444 RepID=A0AAU9KUE7_9STRA|nr:unnamed protein product [Peronospora belbahrii]CAH0518411.1 unnamed protein product [Peronospora belbahrii]
MTLKASVLNGNVVGMEELVSNRQGCLIIRGLIKTKLEDFTVREISVTGKVLDFNDKSDLLPTESEYDGVLKKLEARQQKEKKSRILFDEPADGWRRALTELIGSKSFVGVEDVAIGHKEDIYIASPVESQKRVYL